MHIDSRVRKSMSLYGRAEQLIPGRVQLISRRASRFASGVSPVYAESAKGSRFVDVDGNEYVDWANAVGAVILGHADAVVDGAVKQQIDQGSIYTVNSPKEIELAELLVDAIPSAEMVRYTKGGGEACAVAARIARGTTGREVILFSGYHGWHDWYQSANYLADPTTGEFPFSGIEPIGVPKGLAGTAIPFPENNLDLLNNLMEEHKGQVAAIMMEPMRTELPPEGYLESIRDLASDNGAVLIFDEVTCGFRIAIGGAQEYLGVVPDMTVVAKCMSNGYPMGAVLGSRDVMEPAGQMFVSSSYWSDNIGLVASITTLNELERRDSSVGFKNIGEKLKAALVEAIDATGIAARCVGFYTHPHLEFDVPDESLLPKVKTLFVQEMALRGIHTDGGFKSSLANDDEDIRVTAEAAAESFEVVMQGLEGRLDELLVADLTQEPFRRLVR